MCRVVATETIILFNFPDAACHLFVTHLRGEREAAVINAYCSFFHPVVSLNRPQGTSLNVVDRFMDVVSSAEEDDTTIPIYNNSQIANLT